MKIATLLPMREPFTIEGAGSIALFTSNSYRLTRHQAGVTIYGAPVDAPIIPQAFAPIHPTKWPPRRRTSAYVHGFIRALRANPPDLIEIHNRPKVVAAIARAFPDIPIVLHLHNTASHMAEVATAERRIEMLTMVKRILCCSDFVRDRARAGLPADLQERIRTHHCGIPQYDLDLSAPRKKRIVYAGRLTPPKGVRELIEAALPLLETHPDWSVHIIGGKGHGDADLGAYQKECMALVPPALSERICFHGPIPHTDLMEMMSQSEIVAVPSLWEEPFGRIAAEALMAGAALIQSGRGGLAEIAPDASLCVDPEDIPAFRAGLERMMTDKALLRDLQARGRDRAKAFDEHTRQAWHDDHRSEMAEA